MLNRPQGASRAATLCCLHCAALGPGSSHPRLTARDESAKLICHTGTSPITRAGRCPRPTTAARAAHRAGSNAGSGRGPRGDRRLDAQPPGVRQAPPGAGPRPRARRRPGGHRRRPTRRAGGAGPTGPRPSAAIRRAHHLAADAPGRLGPACSSSAGQPRPPGATRSPTSPRGPRLDLCAAGTNAATARRRPIW